MPCAHCNSDLKFATLAERARGFGADAVATGHYASVEHDPTSAPVPPEARRSTRRRIRSYFLFSLTQEQLARAAFPIGDRPKDAVRAYASGRHGLPVADKPDSQEICFIPDGDYGGVRRRVTRLAQPGDGAIVDEAGRMLGRHDGIHRFTVGQRKGLGLSRLRRTGACRCTCCALDPARAAGRRRARGRRSSARDLTASGVNWIRRAAARAPRRVHRADSSPASSRAGDGPRDAATATPT